MNRSSAQSRPTPGSGRVDADREGASRSSLAPYTLIAASPYAKTLAVPQDEATRVADAVEPQLASTPDIEVNANGVQVTDPTPKKRTRKSKAALVSESSGPTAA